MRYSERTHRQPDRGAMIRAIWQPESLIWAVAVTLGLALVMALTPTSGTTGLVSLSVHFGLLALVGMWIAMLCLAILYVLRPFLERLGPLGIAWCSLAALVASALLVSSTAYFIASPLLGTFSLGELQWRSASVALTVGLLGVAGFQAMWERGGLQERARRSGAAALQARTAPHFLFNTLNTAVILVKQQPEQVETLLLNLADLFRAAIAGKQTVELGEELDLARKYLDIETLRFGPRLHVHWEVPDVLPQVMVPLLAVQSLVENAVLHGIQQQAAGGTVSIDLKPVDQGWEVSVRNPMASAPTGRHQGHGIGLEALRERLRNMEGTPGRLQTAESHGEFVATLWLPRATSTAAAISERQAQSAATTS